MKTNISQLAEAYKSISPLEYSEPRYDLTAEELDQLNKDMVDFANERTGREGLVAIWINPYHRFANLVRMNEAAYFPEVSELTGEDEDQTVFFAMIDTRQGIQRVVHAATSCTRKKSDLQLVEQTETGFITVDSLIEEGNFSVTDFVDYYNSKGIDVSDCISIETNFRVGERTEKLNGVSAAELSYLMFFRRLVSNGADINRSGVFATINRASKISFDRVGLQYEQLLGREDLVTPESYLGVDSEPVFIPYTEHAENLFGALASIGIEIPELEV